MAGIQADFQLVAKVAQTISAKEVYTMETRTLQTEADYQAVLKEISTLMGQDPDEGTPDGDRLNALVTRVQVYEAKHYAIAPPD